MSFLFSYFFQRRFIEFSLCYDSSYLKREIVYSAEVSAGVDNLVVVFEMEKLLVF